MRFRAGKSAATEAAIDDTGEKPSIKSVYEPCSFPLVV